MKKLSLLLLLLSPLALAQSNNLFDDIQIPFTKTVLNNGLTVIVHEDHKAPIVAVNIWYHVGSKNEPKGRNGFAHLFEHLMFQGSENFNDDYFKALDKVGSTDNNGTTNRDRTNYFQTVPSTALDTVLFMESDRMGHFVNAITQARLDEQRKVVLNEKRESENRPYWGIAQEKLVKGSFPVGHPYSWTTIGSTEDLNAATLKDVKEWFTTYYVPNNAVLAIVGDVKTSEAIEKVKKYFGDIPAGPSIPRMKQWTAKRTETKREIVEDNVPFSRLMKSWNVPGYSDELIALDVASDILSSGKTSRLFKELVYNKKLATDVSAYIWDSEIASLFIVDATAKAGVSIAELEQGINQVLAEFISQGPSFDELQRVKTQTMVAFVGGLEKVGGDNGKANTLAGNEIYHDSPVAFQEQLKLRMNLQPPEIQKALKTWITSGDYNLEIHPKQKFTQEKSTLNRKTLPLPTTYPTAQFPTVQEGKLSNGAKILLAQRTHMPLIQVRVAFNAGFERDPKDKQGLAMTTFDLLNEGTTKHDLFSLSDKLDALGSTVDAYVTMNLAGMYAEFLKKNTGPTLDLFAEMILSPTFPQKEFERLVKETLEDQQKQKTNAERLFTKFISQLVYGTNHPYGVPISGTGTEKTITNIKLEDVKNFYATWAKPNNATFIVVGDITMEEITRKLEQRFKNWKPGNIPPNTYPSVKETNGGKIYLINRPDAPQTVISAASLFPSFLDPQETANDVANDIFGGSITSRINLNLREEKGWSYGLRSYPYNFRGDRLWMIHAPVQTDKTIQALTELQKELNGIASQSMPITSVEFEKQKKDSILQLSGIWETNDSIAGHLVATTRYNLPLDYWNKYPQQMQNLQLGSVVQAAQKIFKPKDVVWLLVGDQKKILSDLQKAYPGKIVLMDEDGNIKK